MSSLSHRISDWRYERRDHHENGEAASAGFLDHLPTTGDETGRAFRDLEWEERLFEMAQSSGIGAQFGGKYLAHDIRVIRLPRHAASCPAGIGVSCSADRNIKGKITEDGIFLEELDKNPSRFADMVEIALQPPIEIDLNQPMDDIRAELSKHPVGTRLSLKGTLIVARDIAHAEIKIRLDNGEPMPEYFKNHPVYYAGPAKTPQGLPFWQLWPHHGRSYGWICRYIPSRGWQYGHACWGNRSQQVTDACDSHGGFYLGSIGGPAAILAKENITSVEVVDMAELGMEAVRKIEVVDFPAFIIVDDKGNDLFQTFGK